MDLGPACEQEIIGLHRFFQTWFEGGFADRARGFLRFTDVMAPGFIIVSPKGTVTTLHELAKGLRSAFGSWPDGGTIEVSDVTLRYQNDEVALLTYVERQHVGGKETARLSTAVMREHAAAPNGVCWMHVHETWMPGMAG